MKPGKVYYRSPGQWSRRVSEILAAYRGNDKELAHGLEDEALWDFVKWRAGLGDVTAKRLMRLDRTPRTRWYA